MSRRCDALLYLVHPVRGGGAGNFEIEMNMTLSLKQT